MKEFTVVYPLDDDEIARLEHIKTLFDRYTGTSHSIESVFSLCMLTACARDIKDHFVFEENLLTSLLSTEGGEVA